MPIFSAVSEASRLPVSPYHHTAQIQRHETPCTQGRRLDCLGRHHCHVRQPWRARDEACRRQHMEKGKRTLEALDEILRSAGCRFLGHTKQGIDHAWRHGFPLLGLRCHVREECLNLGQAAPNLRPNHSDACSCQYVAGAKRRVGVTSRVRERAVPFASAIVDPSMSLHRGEIDSGSRPCACMGL